VQHSSHLQAASDLRKISVPSVFSCSILNQAKKGESKGHTTLQVPTLDFHAATPDWTILPPPIIMMSQNRAEARNRLRAENDYKINLKAELEIRHLHEKIDYPLRRQYNRLVEIQQIQIGMLEELGRKEKSINKREGS
jgi:uncharacterized protein DUF1003